MDIPFLLQKEFISEILIYLFSEEYGNVILEVPEYGKYKLRFVAHAREAAEELSMTLYQEVNRLKQAAYDALQGEANG